MGRRCARASRDAARARAASRNAIGSKSSPRSPILCWDRTSSSRSSLRPRPSTLRAPWPRPSVRPVRVGSMSTAMPSRRRRSARSRPRSAAMSWMSASSAHRRGPEGRAPRPGSTRRVRMRSVSISPASTCVRSVMRSGPRRRSRCATRPSPKASPRSRLSYWSRHSFSGSPKSSRRSSPAASLNTERSWRGRSRGCRRWRIAG